MFRFTISFLIVFIGFLSCSAFAQYQDKVLVLKVKEGALNEPSAWQQLNGVLNRCDGELYRIFPNHQSPQEPLNQYGDSLVDLSLWYQLEYAANISYEQLSKQLRATGLFRYIERRPLNELFYTPNDSLLSEQWYLNTIHAFDAWDVEKGDTNVVVGITDTGIDRIQEDLKDGIKYNYQDTLDGIDNDNDGYIDNFCGWDIGNNDNNVQWGPIGHGTFVSGFVSAVPDNAKGIAGVGFHTKILPVKIDNPQGLLIHDYEGIVYAADHGSAIINCSWGGPVFSQFGKDIVDYATFNKNALVVAACGNSNNAVWMYPAAYKNVLSVAATDSSDVRWTLSSYGSRVDLCAPGTGVFSTWVSDYYFSSSGTSFSAPMVAAAAALVKARYPNLSALQLGERVRIATDNIDTVNGNQPVQYLMGSGRLNVYRALTDTLKPAIRFDNVTFELNTTGDTLILWGDFTNYLTRSSSALQASIHISSPYLQGIDTLIQLGVMATMATQNNAAQPFKIKVLQGLPLGFIYDIRVNYSDTAYQDFEFVRLELNREYRNLDTNEIALTISAKGRLGFNDDAMNEGLGMLYKGGRNILSFGGLMLATSTNKVSDNIYGEQGFDHDFDAMAPIVELQNGPGDQSFYSVFNDNGAGFSRQYVKVKQYSYAFDQSSERKYAIMEYHIFNTGSQKLTDLYAGVFTDFDIGISNENKARYDQAHQMAYTWQVGGNKYAAISMLEGLNPNCFNIDNDGSDGSVNIYDGFYSFEKYQVLTQSRDSAAWTASGNDVSNVLSAGPYTIAPGDSIVVAFAILAGDYLSDIQQTAQAAYDKYYNTLSVANRPQSDASFALQVVPNPFSNKARLRFRLDETKAVRIVLYDYSGRELAIVAEGLYQKGEHSISLNAEQWPAGIYYLKLYSEGREQSLKVLIGE